MIWLPSRIEIFSGKAERWGGTEVGESRCGVDSGWEWLVPFSGLLHKTKLAEVAGSCRVLKKENKKKKKQD